MSTNLEKLQKLLRELFQLDQADLDFGIYRIMNHNRDEIVRFLENDLLPQVQEGFGEYEAADKERLKEELQQAIAQAKDLGLSQEEADNTKKAQDLRQRIQSQADIEALEQEVYAHLYSFFRRYYHEGDFLSLRRYKEGVYAIPYEGEEVKLHWANADQYYIKTSENFRNYAFKLPSERRVRFEIVAATTERDNNKAPNGKERRFILCDAEPAVIEQGELMLRFEYRVDEEKRKQEDLNQLAAKQIMALPDLQDWQQELALKDPTEKNPDRTLLDKYLTDFTAKNTFDYFIHKNLGGFLRRELDFYLKSDVIRVEDLENESPTRLKHFLSKVKVLRSVANKIITFLAQIEDFQKKLWLKKKFVLETHYCITLDRVPEELYPEIIANKAQIEEWRRLFAIDGIEGNLVTPGYTDPLPIDFLEVNRNLILDTKFFDDDFRSKLLACYDDLESIIDGVLIQGENFQALSLLHSRYKGLTKFTYIDAPYNTGKDDFIYKDAYQHSSWLSMISDRLKVSQELMTTDGVVFSSIDEQELPVLRPAMSEIYNNEMVGTIVWKGATDNNPTRITTEHEYILCFAKDNEQLASVWQNPNDAKKQIMLDKYDEIRKFTSNVEEIKRCFREFIRNNEEILTLLTHYNRIDDHGPYTGSRKVHNPGREGYIFDVIHLNGKPCARPARGYRFPEETYLKLLEAGKIIFGEDENQIIQIKEYLEDYSGNLKSIIELDSRVATNTLEKLFGSREIFRNPKPTSLIEELLGFTTNTTDVVIDFFAGSGTTGHAVINLNSEDGGQRKYILIEMGVYFDAVLRPRIEKVIYSKDWQAGKPTSRQGSSHCFKYMRLESYEDTLNNIKKPERTQQQELALEQNPRFREEYLLSYKLDTEARDSVSLLNPAAFVDPFSYQLKVIQNDDTRYVTVDLVETFNYLLGLTVQRIRHIENVRVVQGINRNEQRVLILWRNLEQVDHDALDNWFIQQGFNSDEPGFDLLYVNGDNNLENLRPANQTWRVLLIDAEFPRLMFDIQEV